MSLRIPRTTRTHGLATFAVALSLLSSTAANAEIVIGDDTAETTATTRGELLLMIWDPVKEVSYTKDLGLNAYAATLSIGDPANNLFVAGQQDAGVQRFWDSLNTDANFAKFREKSTDAANQYWAILGGSATSDVGSPGSLSIFTTVKHATASGTVNPEYAKLTKWSNEELAADFYIPTYFTILNAGNSSATAEFNTHNTPGNGSSFNAKGEGSYVGELFPNGVDSGLGTAAPTMLNKVGSSSWFYHVTVADGGGNGLVAVDEFDNGVLGKGNDAYWGLDVDPSTGNYMLSYTLAASLTPVQTATGQLLRLRTDFAAIYGGTRLIGAPAGDTLDLGNVSAVPEPSTWGLMGLGLALLAGRARRRA